MAPMTKISLLLEEPIGYFTEVHLAPGKEVPHTLSLYSVMMAFNEDVEVGLDDTEYLLPPQSPPTSVQEFMHGNIHVFGILEIEKLEWLSEKGYEYLEKKLRRRDDDGRLVVTRPSELSLRGIWPQIKALDEKVKVVFSFEKGFNAYYREPEADPFQDIHVKSRHRPDQTYLLKTMQPGCYEKCLNWLSRYQLVHAFERIVKKNPVPIKDRTVEWFLQQYREHILPEDRHRRIITDPTERSSSPITRRPRYVSEWDLRGRVADHCEWLLANQIASNSQKVQLFNAEAWIRFCDQTQEDRRASKYAWGMGKGEATRWRPGDTLGDRYGFERFGGSKEVWYQKLEAARKRTNKRSIPKSVPMPAPNFSAPKGETSTRRSKRIQHQFDYEFEGSTAGETEEESSDEELTSLIPWMKIQPPILVPGRPKWCCSYGECTFEVKLSELHEEHKPDCLRDCFGCWEAYQTILRSIVYDHYKEHLPIEFVKVDGGRLALNRKGEPVRRRSKRRPERPRIKREET